MGTSAIEPPEDIDLLSGVLCAHRDGELIAGWARGFADRSFGVLNTLATRFGTASITKTFTAAAVLSLVADGTLSLATTARSILGPDLPLIADDVTIDLLLSHRSGIGDYLDEDIDEYAALTMPVQQLDRTEAYVPLIDGFETKFPAGERFSYCNGGFVVLAILAERAAGAPYTELVRARVFDPAGMTTADFARSDRPEPQTAVGYTPDGSTNIFDLPVLGIGDGGAHAAAADLDAFWRGLLGGRILPASLVEAMTERVTSDAEDGDGYGRGLWLTDGLLMMLGGDHGITANSSHDPATGVTVTLLSNEQDIPVMKRVNGLRAAIGR